MRPLLHGLFPLALLALGAACSQQAEGDDTAVGSDQHLTEATPIPPATWATCWFESNGSNDAFYLAYTMTCHGPDSKYPLPAQVLVSGLDLSNTEAINGQLDDTDKKVGAFYAQKLPLAFEVSIGLRTDQASGFVSEIDPADFRFNQRIEHPEQITKDHPLVVTAPFGLWKLEIVQKTSRFTFLPDGAIGRDSTPFVVGFTDKTKFDVNNTAVSQAQDGKPVSLLFVAPVSGKLGARYVNASADKRLTLDTPGTYVAEDDGLRKATDADLGGGPGEPAPTTEAGAPPPDPQPEAGPPPTCGVANLPCCGGSGGTCGGGSYCKAMIGQPDTCTACGGAGQECCGGSGGSCGAGLTCTAQFGQADTCQ